MIYFVKHLRNHISTFQFCWDILDGFKWFPWPFMLIHQTYNQFILYIGRFPHLEFEDKLKYVSKWMLSHIEDGHYELNKPVFFTEFGLSNLNKDFQPSQRDRFYKTIFDIIYKSAKRKRAGAGALIWQLFVEGMDEFNDDFGFVPWERESTYRVLTDHSCRLARIQGITQQNNYLKELCLQRQ